MTKGAIVVFSLLIASGPYAPGGARQQAPAPLHVLKIAAGPGGVEEKGTFTLTEERTSFSRSEHREIVVLFQWEGVPGKHKLEATWRSPNGSSTSVIDYVARDKKFGAYWKLAITPTMALGPWSIEATVDGQPGGRLSFEVVDTAAAPATPAAPVKRALTQQEMYDALAKAFVVVGRGADGARELEPVGGVVGAEGQVFTTVKMLDAVKRLQAVFAGGATQELTHVLQMNRSAGWAILPARTDGATVLARASELPEIGSRCYSMHGTPAGARVLIEGQVTGRSAAGNGWIVSFVNGAGLAGAPVVNQYGELLGILATSALGDLQIGYSGATASFGDMPLIPVAAIAPVAGAAPVSLEVLRARGDLLEPLVGETHVVSGGFAATLDRGPTVRADDQRREFSTKEKEMVVFVTWNPRERLKGMTTFQFYDAANRLIVSSKPVKVDLRKGDLIMSSLRVPVFKQPGTYRAEIHLDGKPAWRDYVRIIP